MARFAPPDLVAALTQIAGATHRLDGIDYTVGNNPSPWIEEVDGTEVVAFNLKAVRVADGAILSRLQTIRRVANTYELDGVRSKAEWLDIARSLAAAVLP